MDSKLFGNIFLIFGIIALVGHALRLVGVELPLLFSKLEPMQERWGLAFGTILHVASYGLFPLIIGLRMTGRI